ncbi:MAG: ABC transporter substrate-binding protein [Bacteroidia bacterium]|nr:ABC transporter substrate-binding protein [Bacteroidia bacterium]
MRLTITISILWVFFFELIAQSPDVSKPIGDAVYIRHPEDPIAINPILVVDDIDKIVTNQVFQYLTIVNPDRMQRVPWLLKRMPIASRDSSYYLCELREEASWDNGLPITAEDVLFTLKAIYNPFIPCTYLKEFFSGIEDVVIDKKDKKKFKIYVAQDIGENIIYPIPVMPRHFYDRQNDMAKFTLQQLKKEKDKLKNDPFLKNFATFFTDSTNIHNPSLIYGSGAYRVVKWIPNDEVVLERKVNWWGDKLKKYSELIFGAYPKRLIYKTVKEMSVTITMLKLGDLDLIYNIPAKEFTDIEKLDSNYYHYRTRKANTLAYSYLGFNIKPENRIPYFDDINVRRAVSYALPVDSMMKFILKGYGVRISAPGSPTKEISYNPNLPLYAYDIKKAKQLLKDAGWQDTDNDAILDKVVNGKKIDFVISLLINNLSPDNRKIAYLVTRSLGYVGIGVTVEEKTLSEYIKALQNHEFDMYLAENIEDADFQDPELFWHTKNWENKGANYTGFGNGSTDAFIETIKNGKNLNKAKFLYHALMSIIHEQQPCIPLWSPQNIIVASDRFQNFKAYTEFGGFPGINPANLWTPVEKQKYK